MAMGLSLGECTALYTAGMLSFPDAVLLTHKRGRAMQAASDAYPTGMAPPYIMKQYNNIYSVGMVSIVGLLLSIVQLREL